MSPYVNGRPAIAARLLRVGDSVTTQDGKQLLITHVLHWAGKVRLAWIADDCKVADGQFDPETKFGLIAAAPSWTSQAVAG